MAIIEWVESASAASLTASRLGRREWSAPYMLISDNDRDDAQVCVDFMDTIGRGLSMPFRYGDREDFGSFCKQIRAVRRAQSTKHWDVTCSYAPWEGDKNDNEQKETKEGEPAESPLDWRWDISLSVQSLQVPVEKAWNMDPFPPNDGGSGGVTRPVYTLGPMHNSAGITYDPPMMRNVNELILRVTANTQEYDSNLATQFVNAINSVQVSWSAVLQTYYGMKADSFPPYCVKCLAAGGVYRRTDNISYWAQTWEFALRERASELNPQDGFLETVLDRGFSRIANGAAPDGRGGTISGGDIKTGMAIASPIRDLEGERPPEMVLLNGHGQPLQTTSTWSQNPVWFRWRLDKLAVFQAIPIDIFDV